MEHKKAFFNEQCIKLEENNRRGKTRDLFRKLEISRKHFVQRRVTINGRNGRDLVDAEEIKKDGNNAQNCTRRVQMNWITTVVWSAIQSQKSWRAKSSGP